MAKRLATVVSVSDAVGDVHAVVTADNTEYRITPARREPGFAGRAPHVGEGVVLDSGPLGPYESFRVRSWTYQSR